MKMKLTSVILAGSVLLFAGTTQASTIMAPTDQNVNVFTLLTGGAGLQVAMFDDSDTTYAGAFLDINFTTGDVLSFSPTIGQNVNYTVTNNAFSTLTLTGNDMFSLALRQSAGPWMSPTSVVCNSNTNSCTATWDGLLTNLVVDVTKIVPPIPVPAAAWLFGTGLIGLVGVARRRSPAA